jgi:hypothetical protein
VKDILSNDYSLAIPLYVDKIDYLSYKDQPPLQDIFDSWFLSTENSKKATSRVLSLILEEESL